MVVFVLTSSSTHASIHLLLLTPGSGRSSSSFAREAQIFLSPATLFSCSGEIPRRSQASRETQRGPTWVFPMASSQWDMPKHLAREVDKEASSSNAIASLIASLTASSITLFTCSHNIWCTFNCYLFIRSFLVLYLMWIYQIQIKCIIIFIKILPINFYKSMYSPFEQQND